MKSIVARCAKSKNGCLIWPKAKDRDGYGVASWRGRYVRAHRLAWQQTNGSIPEGLLVLHRCDNPPCCNPDHLWLGTHADNQADKKAKGRAQKQNGESNGRAKLTKAQVLSILADPRRQIAIAADYGVSRSSICLIKARKHWAHLSRINI